MKTGTVSVISPGKAWDAAAEQLLEAAVGGEADSTDSGRQTTGGHMRTEQETSRAIELYSDMIRRICLLHLKNHADTEDVFQEVFLKYVLCGVVFESVEHEKAWLIRVTVNACKDFLKSLFHRRTVPLEVLSEEAASVSPEQYETLEAVLALPEKYKDVIYLYYYEGYNVREVASILKKKENTVYTLLSRGRELLRQELGGDVVG
ncbi:RNA polymerase sigma factor [Anaerotruncus colihominis]